MGTLDDAGLALLRSRLAALCEFGCVSLIADLSGVSECDHRLFSVLSETHQVIAARGGWLRLVGVGSPVLAALDLAPLPDALMVYRASDWAFQPSAVAVRVARADAGDRTSGRRTSA